MGTKSCGTCEHLYREEESWELSHIWWLGCNARPAMANLKSFPFKDTKCRSWKKRTKPPVKYYKRPLEDLL